MNREDLINWYSMIHTDPWTKIYYNLLSMLNEYPSFIHQDCCDIILQTSKKFSIDIYRNDRLIKSFENKKYITITDCFYFLVIFVEEKGTKYKARLSPCKFLQSRKKSIIFYEYCEGCLKSLTNTITMDYEIINRKTGSMLHYNINKSLIRLDHNRFLFEGKQYFMPECLLCKRYYKNIKEHIEICHPAYEITLIKGKFRINCCENVLRNETSEYFKLEKKDKFKYEKENFTFFRRRAAKKRVKKNSYSGIEINYNHIFNLMYSDRLQSEYDERKFYDYVTFSTREQNMMVRWNYIFKEQYSLYENIEYDVRKIVLRALKIYFKKYSDWEEMVCILYVKGILTDKEILKAINN